ncbi:queuosine precursor transporter [Candidatus Peregrinibacteria bacterium]|nr:queuosine precursor transporter [Candidatus Peregrinibacteria bacterium]
MRTYKYLGFITAFFVMILIVSNVASSKILLLGPFTFDGGTILFPISYIFGDVLTEVYGYAKARKVIWLGFFMTILAALVFYIVGALPAAPDWGGQAAYNQILGIVPRIVLGSVIAFAVGEFANSYIMARMKVEMKGKQLWIRTIGSTLVGEAFDSCLFVGIAFGGIFSPELLWAIMISNYIFKVGIEVLFTPLTYAVCGALKRSEKEDYYDKKTDFNPFILKED